MSRRYTEAQHAFIRERWARMTNAELAEACAEGLGIEVTAKAMSSYGKNRGWRKDPGVRERAISAGQGSVWDAERDEFIRAYVPGHHDAETVAAFRERFGVELTAAQLSNRKAALGVRSGTVGGRFELGHVPASKGRPWAEWMPRESAERSLRTAFRPGQQPHNEMPVGSERVTPDGYVEVKVAERPSGRTAHDNWVPKARLVWERANGRPVPEGSMVVFLDGDRANLAPDNLALESRGEHATISRMRVAYCDRGSHDVAVAVARLRSAASRARRHGHGE